MNIAGVLDRAARSFGAQPAIAHGDHQLCGYAELGQRVRCLAGNLRTQHGLADGDRVGVVMGNCPAYFEVLFAIWHAGLCAVPMNARLHAREIAYIMESADATVAFVDAKLEETVAPLRDEIACLEHVVSVDGAGYARLLQGPELTLVERQPDDIAWLFYTSGTTGRPKGAMLTHRNLFNLILSHYADIDQIRPTDTMIYPAPLSHGCGLWSIANIAKAANNVVLESGSYNPAEICRLLARYPVISMYHAPTMLKRLVNAPEIGDTDLGNLKTLIYGGSHMYLADLQRALDVLGPKLVQIYGQGESPNTISLLSKEIHADRTHPRYLERLGSAGIARSGLEIRIADAEDRPLPPGEVGEIHSRGDITMAGYWRNPQATAETLRGGWLHTGDVGFMDEDGFISLKDRSKDMIISGGTNIYPREIEEVLLRHEAVLEASVVGRPHPDWGEEVVAFVVPRPGQQVSEAELDRCCLDNIARFKRPKSYIFLDELPKSNYGKILKTALRDRLVDKI